VKASFFIDAFLVCLASHVARPQNNEESRARVHQRFDGTLTEYADG
jgi:hypothetical protein